MLLLSSSSLSSSMNADDSQRSDDALKHSDLSISDHFAEDFDDWNGRYQTIQDHLLELHADTNASIQEIIKTHEQLLSLVNDFQLASSTYARVIISEYALPAKQKSLKVIPLGGIAGGDKYVVRNILFKFAVDSHSIFGGSDTAAAKVSGHEMKGMSSYYSAAACLPATVSTVSSASAAGFLHFPLMCMIDYRGFRVTAMSVMPVKPWTLCYGTQDAAHCINSHPRVAANFRRLGQKLNLKPHQVRAAPGQETQSDSVTMFSACDLEGHVGTDGRIYAVDFSRALPPQSQAEGVRARMGHLFRLFRPEFVRRWSLPLCPDAYSSFVKGQQDARAHSDECDAATRHLLGTVVPQLSAHLPRLLSEHLSGNNATTLNRFQLSSILHRAGVNVRWLGLLRHHSRNDNVRSLLLVEAVARVIKQEIRWLMRQQCREDRVPSDQRVKSLIVMRLNETIAHSDTSLSFFAEFLRPRLVRKFPMLLSFDEWSARNDLHSLLLFDSAQCDGSLMILERIAAQTGILFRAGVLEQFREAPNRWLERGDSPLSEQDLHSFECLVKEPAIYARSLGYQALGHALEAERSDLPRAIEFLRASMRHFQRACIESPDSVEALLRLADVRMRLVMLEMKRDSALRQLHLVEQDLSRAWRLEPYNSNVLCALAKFNDRLSKDDRLAKKFRRESPNDSGGKAGREQRSRLAEEFYLRALEADGENVEALQEYAALLTDRSDFIWAEKLMERYESLTTQKEK